MFGFHAARFDVDGRGRTASVEHVKSVIGILYVLNTVFFGFYGEHVSIRCDGDVRAGRKRDLIPHIVHTLHHLKWRYFLSGDGVIRDFRCRDGIARYLAPGNRVVRDKWIGVVPCQITPCGRPVGDKVGCVRQDPGSDVRGGDGSVGDPAACDGIRRDAQASDRAVGIRDGE